MGDYKTGDRVRVTFEGDALEDGGVLLGDGFKLWSGSATMLSVAVSIDQIEKLVVKFGPAQTVRHKKYPYLIYSLGFTGYYAHFDGSWYPNDDPKNPALDFTDADYELLEVK